MGASTSKQPDPVDELKNDFACLYADIMEKADWHGLSKPTWQQTKDYYLSQ